MEIIQFLAIWIVSYAFGLFLAYQVIKLIEKIRWKRYKAKWQKDKVFIDNMSKRLAETPIDKGLSIIDAINAINRIKECNERSKQ